MLNFLAVLVIVFPSVTGVMAGANMSGDLADPGKSIGVGTLSALYTAYGVYVFVIFVRKRDYICRFIIIFIYY